MSEVAVEIEEGMLPSYRADAALEGISAEEFLPKRFGGGMATAVMIIPIISSSIPFITKMVIAEIEARRHVVVKIDGVEIRGISESKLERILIKAKAAREGNGENA